MLESQSLVPEEATAFNARITAANETFHEVIHGAAANERVRRYLTKLQLFFLKGYVWRAVRSADEARTLNIDDHAAVRAALAAGDGAAASDAMSDHIERLLMAHLDEHGLWG